MTPRFTNRSVSLHPDCVQPAVILQPMSCLISLTEEELRAVLQPTIRGQASYLASPMSSTVGGAHKQRGGWVNRQWVERSHSKWHSQNWQRQTVKPEFNHLPDSQMSTSSLHRQFKAVCLTSERWCWWQLSGVKVEQHLSTKQRASLDQTVPLSLSRGSLSTLESRANLLFSSQWCAQVQRLTWWPSFDWPNDYFHLKTVQRTPPASSSCVHQVPPSAPVTHLDEPSTLNSILWFTLYPGCGWHDVMSTTGSEEAHWEINLSTPSTLPTPSQ